MPSDRIYDYLDIDVREVEEGILKAAVLSPFGRDHRMLISQDKAMMDVVDAQRPEGGILTWLRGFAYPFWGYPFIEKVKRIEASKKIVPNAATLLTKKPFKIILGLIWLLLPRVFNRMVDDAIDCFVEFAHPTVEQILTQHQKQWNIPFKFQTEFSPPVKEIQRAANRVIGAMPTDIKYSEYIKIKERIEKGTDIFCVWVDSDNAYRLKLQDLFGIFNIEQMLKSKKEFIKEFYRSITVMANREIAGTRDVEQWTQIRDILCHWLKRDKKYFPLLQKWFEFINVEKMVLTEADKYYCLRRTDYDFEGTGRVNTKLEQKITEKRAKLLSSKL